MREIIVNPIKDGTGQGKPSLGYAFSDRVLSVGSPSFLSQTFIPMSRFGFVLYLSNLKPIYTREFLWDVRRKILA